MTDQALYAEHLIMTVARAFYEDDAICLIDILIRDKFLRDDDMSMRLSLPAKQLRRTLQFLQEEHLVKCELVDDLAEGGSQATKFWYIDYNHAVNTIRLRIYLLGKKLEEAELRARSSSIYLCPGYSTKECNGRYTEIEAQQVVDPETGRFLCQECYKAHVANPDGPPKSSYTLEIVDSSKALKQASNDLRRVKVQLSGKTIGKQQIRMGIYDLLQKVRGGVTTTPGPLTSNLPSENRVMNIGTKRVAGTGRTAGIKMKKLMGFGKPMGDHTRKHIGRGMRDSEDEPIFLKNAVGQHIAFELDKGAAARAHLLVSRRDDRDIVDDKRIVTERWTKCLDAAAIRAGVEPDLVAIWALKIKRRREEKSRSDSDQRSIKKYKQSLLEFSFLINNIGPLEEEEDNEYLSTNRMSKIDSNESDTMDNFRGGIMVVEPEIEAFERMSDEEKRNAFQAYYKKELSRQRCLLLDLGVDESNIPWEDG